MMASTGTNSRMSTTRPRRSYRWLQSLSVFLVLVAVTFFATVGLVEYDRQNSISIGSIRRLAEGYKDDNKKDNERHGSMEDDEVADDVEGEEKAGSKDKKKHGFRPFRFFRWLFGGGHKDKEDDDEEDEYGGGHSGSGDFIKDKIHPTKRSVGTCRNADDIVPHQQGVWDRGFPNLDKPTALCEGNIEVYPDGSVCVDGRVTYEQIVAAAGGKPMHAPASKTISVNGHLISGTGNVVLGPQRRYLLDFVTSYVINGVNYTADVDMLNNVLAASYGTIDGFCLDGSIFDGPPRYKIHQKVRIPGLMDSNDIHDASIIYGAFHSFTIETYEALGRQKSLLDIFSIGTVLNNFLTLLPFPQILAYLTPGFLGFTGLLRYIFIFGPQQTKDFPQPVEAPDLRVENWQIDAPWDSLLNAIDDGLFAKPRIPFDMGVVIKRISPMNNTLGCWNTDMANIDIMAPVAKTGLLDEYVENDLYPYLAEHGPVTVHLGKRLRSSAAVYKANWDFYESCGLDTNIMDIPIDECYHPACRRYEEVNEFTYPEQYYIDYDDLEQQEQEEQDSKEEEDDRDQDKSGSKDFFTEGDFEGWFTRQ